ncbi:alpha/beta fold hydrolase [Arvimicrobium flavum]|uniref:alpha/beta fold hydrolase n=1 Tax=Arvimicrobium flavum TaxID=3393320 RepID=UPI00237B77E6|nr:alpha/beta hydrolase [Mesorhizobium shangrilense]
MKLARMGDHAAAIGVVAGIAATQSQAAERSGFVERDGYRLNFSVEGEGDIRLLIIGSIPYYQRTFAPELRKKMQIAFIDHRGFVEAPAGQTVDDVKLAKVLGDIEALRTEIGWEAPIVLGHSGHGFMAIEYAKLHADNVSGVVLMNHGPSNSEEDRAVTERNWSELVAPARQAIEAGQMAQLGMRIEKNPQDRFLLFTLAMGARSWADASYDARPLWEGVPINLPAIDQMWGIEFAELNIAAGLGSFDRPVLMLAGKWDYLVPALSTWDRVRGDFRDLTVRVFANSGHTPMLEEPEAFEQVLFSWISEKVGN